MRSLYTSLCRQLATVLSDLFLNTSREDGDLCWITQIRLVLQFMLNQEISGHV